MRMDTDSVRPAKRAFDERVSHTAAKRSRLQRIYGPSASGAVKPSARVGEHTTVARLQRQRHGKRKDIRWENANSSQHAAAAGPAMAPRCSLDFSPAPKSASGSAGRARASARGGPERGGGSCRRRSTGTTSTPWTRRPMLWCGTCSHAVPRGARAGADGPAPVAGRGPSGPCPRASAAGPRRHHPAAGHALENGARRARLAGTGDLRRPSAAALRAEPLAPAGDVYDRRAHERGRDRVGRPSPTLPGCATNAGGASRPSRRSPSARACNSGGARRRAAACDDPPRFGRRSSG